MILFCKKEPLLYIPTTTSWPGATPTVGNKRTVNCGMLLLLLEENSCHHWLLIDPSIIQLFCLFKCPYKCMKPKDKPQ